MYNIYLCFCNCYNVIPGNQCLQEITDQFNRTNIFKQIYFKVPFGCKKDLHVNYNSSVCALGMEAFKKKKKKTSVTTIIS